MAPGVSQTTQDVVLGPVIDGDHFILGFASVFDQVAEALVLGPARLGPGIGLAAGHVFGQIHTIEAGPRFGFGNERVDIELARRLVADHAVRRAFIADASRQPTGIKTR